MTGHSVSVLTLAWADLRGLCRSAFGLAAVAVLTGLVAVFMAFALFGTTAFRDSMIFLCMVPELLVGIVLASRIASSRRTRFVESLYTTPLQVRTWLAAHAIVGLAIGAFIIAVHLPFVAVATALVGLPHMVAQVLLAAFLVMLSSVALGLFVGIVVGQAGPAAAAGLAGGFAALSFVGMILHVSLADLDAVTSTGEVLLRGSAISPLALAFAVARLDVTDAVASSPWRPLVGWAALTFGLAAAASLAALRLQGPLGWEARRGRSVVAVLAVAALAVPIATAGTSFEAVEVPESFLHEPGDHTRIAFVEPGTPITNAPFTLESLVEWGPLDHGKETALDLLVMIVVPAKAQVRQVNVQVTGSDAVEVLAGGRLSVPDGRPHGEAQQQDGWQESTTGPLRPVYRVPVTVRPWATEAVRGSPGLVEVHTTFQADGEPTESHARYLLDASIPGASWALLGAGLPAPLGALAALVTRKVRTR